MSGMSQISLLIFWKTFYLGSSEKASGNPIFDCFSSPWKCRASSPALSWKNSSSIPPNVISPDTDLFPSMFLIQTPLSMQEAVGPPSGSDFFSFQNPGSGMCKFHNFYGNKVHKCIFPLFQVGKLKRRRTFTVSAAMPAHTTATATDELTNDRYLVDTGATLSIVPCTSNDGPSGPQPSYRGQMDNQFSLGDLF